MQIRLSKKDCRNIFISRRQELSSILVGQYSEMISHLLFTHFNLEQKTISLFLPIEFKREVNTYIILEKAMTLETKVCIPKANFETLELVHYLYESADQLELSEYRIPEPKFGTIISQKKLDYVIVPLIAYDKLGNRVGYGKGFYDNLLKKCSKETIFIGLSMFEPIDEIIDVREDDIPLHYCITPERKINF